MKNWFVAKVLVGVLAAFFIVSGFNMAYAERDGRQCHNVSGLIVDCSSSTAIDNSINNSNTVTATGGDASANNNNMIGNTVFGDTFSPSAEATIEKGAVDVDNKNTNLNTNLNTNKNEQGQIQGQVQSIAGSGNSKNDNSNDGNKQKVNIVVEGDTFEAEPNHIRGPELVGSSAKLTENKGFSFRTMGGVWSDIDGISVEAAKSLGKGSSDAEVEKALMYEHAAINYIRKATADIEAVFLGTIYVYPDGDDVTVAGMEGVGLSAAMAAGATHASIQYDKGDVADGSSWNVGLGGGASIVANANGSVMVAPNGGLGVGGATAFNTKLPALAIKLYYDVTVIK